MEVKEEVKEEVKMGVMRKAQDDRLLKQ